jgi:hypothetical protein
MPNTINQVIPQPERTDYALKSQGFIDAALELVRFDEVERALVVLEQMPGLYRDHKLPEIEDLKRRIRAALITPHAYMSAELDQDVTVEGAKNNIHHLLRGKALAKEVGLLNAQKIYPHIVDVGPGEYWVPIGLEEAGYTFTYNPVAMDRVAASLAAPLIQRVKYTEPGNLISCPKIFLAHEIIEHLPSTDDLVIECLRHCGEWPDYVHMSTPRYTYDVQEKNWDRPCGLPHLRTYTPQEFLLEAHRLFPGYNWEIAADIIMSVRGYKKGGPILGEIK